MNAHRDFVQVPYLQLASLELPEELERLRDLAYNLWWSWNPATRQLFSAIDQASWARYRNPVQLLRNVGRGHWETLIDNDTFMESYAAVVRDLDVYMSGRDGTWFRKRFPDYAGGPFAYFSMEYGVHQSLAIYSGGLGVLSGDHCKSASDLGLPFLAVGLLYRFGYFKQTVDMEGNQQHHYPEYDFLRLPLRPALRRGEPLVVRVPLPGREVAAQVWLAQIGRVPLLLLDTDLRDNDPADRPITNVLYVGGREMRLEQETVLGVGGARALAELGIEPAVWHLNEGHSAPLQLERLRRAVAAGADLDTALDEIRAGTVFTTHTPVPAGNEQFERSLARPYLEVWAEPLGTDAERLLDLGQPDHGEAGQPFNLTAFALRTSRFVNGVSRLNAGVASRMWRHLLPGVPGSGEPIEAITNGVHVPSWLGFELGALLREALGRDFLEWPRCEEAWKGVFDIPDRELWAAHQAQKERLGRFTRSRLLEQLARHGRSPSELRRVADRLDPDVLTIGFARRFATYKRAGLLFSDPHRLRTCLGHPTRPLQILLAGKAHPADRPGQALIRHIFQLGLEPELRGRVVYLENYDIRVGRMLVQGVDLWLNTPRRSMEASGTSGQKAAFNGVLNLSVLDGWWPEAFDGRNGWSIGGPEASGDETVQDQADALALYRALEEEVLPAFYERDGEGVPVRWVQMMKHAMATIGPRFSSDRMVRDYVERAYLRGVPPGDG